MSDSAVVARWIAFAQKDYDAALNMAMLHRPAPVEIICYHCQQSSEKILKAYIIALSGQAEKTHDLESILKQCMAHDNRFGSFAGICATLSAYAVASRYPLDDDWINEQDMLSALGHAEKILCFTKARILEIG